MQGIRAFDPKKNKDVFVGTIQDDTFVKTFRDEHIMRIFNGIGIQKGVLKQLIEKKVRYIQVKHEKGHMNLVAPLQSWLKYGIERDVGHGKQIFLNFNFMSVVGQGKLFE